MRYIDTSSFARSLPAGWEDRANSALEEVRASAVEQRADSINQRSDLWRTLKDELKKLSFGKCWYCESFERRSDDAVDHFRPKNRVAGVSHPGYWWLAFDWRNYRYSCTFCNSRRRSPRGTTGGKHDDFPLVHPENRVHDEGDVSCEYPVLLDPTVAADTMLLYFREDGEVEPRFRGADTTAEMRADVSIRVYHLREQDLIDARMELYNRIRELIELGMTFYNAWQSGDAPAKKAFDTAYASLEKCVADRAEFSAAAKTFIKGLRHSGHPWIDLIC